MNPLLTALERAADKHGKPVIGSRPGRAGFFPALLFSEDHAFVPGSDGYTVYEFDGRSTAAGVYSWRDLGSRNNVLDAMAAHAEAHLVAKDTPVCDEYSAEWLDALARDGARPQQQPPFVPESTQLYQWFITRFAIANPAWELMDITPIERGVKLRIGMNSNEIVSAGLMVVVKGILTDAVLDESLTPFQIMRVAVAARRMLKAGRIGKETSYAGESVDRPGRYRVADGWQVERTERAAPASNFYYWYMARGIVISAHEAAAVAAQEARA